MFRVMDLFAGTQSVKKQLTKSFNISSWDLRPDGIWIGYNNFTPVVEYAAFDIESPEDQNIHFDLSQDNIVVKLAVLLGNWKPDFIWASPICNKFSSAATGKGGNSYFIVENSEIREREREEYMHVNHNGINKRPDKWDDYRKDAKLAMKLHKNLVKIINHYQVNFVIENPANALSRYLYKNYFRAVVDYCAYGFEYKKPTAIYSSTRLFLKRHSPAETHRHIPFDRINKSDKFPSHWNKNISNYANRSSVPPKLIEHILKLSMEQWKFGWGKNGKR